MADNYSINATRLTAVHLSLGPIDLAIGLADGASITLTLTDPARDAVQGGDGRSVAFDTNKDLAELTVNYLSTSPAVAQLIALHNLNKLKATSGEGDFSLLYIQGSTGRRVASAKAFVMQIPDIGDDNTTVPENSFTIKLLDTTVV